MPTRSTSRRRRGERWLTAVAPAAVVAVSVAVAVALAGHGSAAARGGSAPGALVVSAASPDVVQPQPRPGSCHSAGDGLDARPDPRCTPGAVNPAVTPAAIGRTICVAGWTARVRPPEQVTEAEKRASLAAYGERGPLRRYEYDHLVPLELGGALNDPRNLWPEPGASPNPKDRVEDRLHGLVCAHRLGLRTAQEEIAVNWVALLPRVRTAAIHR